MSGAGRASALGWECWVRTGWGARAVRGHASRLTCLSIALNLHVRCDSACPQLCRARARACQVRPGPVSRRATAQGCPPRVLCAPSSLSARVVGRAQPHTSSRWCSVAWRTACALDWVHSTRRACMHRTVRTPHHQRARLTRVCARAQVREGARAPQTFWPRPPEGGCGPWGCARALEMPCSESYIINCKVNAHTHPPNHTHTHTHTHPHTHTELKFYYYYIYISTRTAATPTRGSRTAPPRSRHCASHRIPTASNRLQAV
jgi:hypothetical protein